MSTLLKRLLHVSLNDTTKVSLNEVYLFTPEGSKIFVGEKNSHYKKIFVFYDIPSILV